MNLNCSLKDPTEYSSFARSGETATQDEGSCLSKGMVALCGKAL